MIETPQKHDRFLPTNPSIPTPYFGSLAIRVTGSEGSLFRQKESGDRKKMVEHLPRGENKKKSKLWTGGARKIWTREANETRCFAPSTTSV